MNVLLRQVKCADESADEIINKAAEHKINLRKLDSEHVSVALMLIKRITVSYSSGNFEVGTVAKR